MTRGTLIQLILIGFFVFAIVVVVYVVFDFSKKMSNKDGRRELKEEVVSTGKFIATDRDFHKGLSKDFGPLIILLSILGFVGLLTLLGIGG